MASTVIVVVVFNHLGRDSLWFGFRLIARGSNRSARGASETTSNDGTLASAYRGTDSRTRGSTNSTTKHRFEIDFTCCKRYGD